MQSQSKQGMKCMLKAKQESESHSNQMISKDSSFEHGKSLKDMECSLSKLHVHPW